MNSHPELQRPTPLGIWFVHFIRKFEPDGSKWFEKTDHGLVTYLPQLKVKGPRPSSYSLSFSCDKQTDHCPTNPLDYIFFFLGCCNKKNSTLLNEWMQDFCVGTKMGVWRGGGGGGEGGGSIDDSYSRESFAMHSGQFQRQFWPHHIWLVQTW
jgi:hypothetical protein